MFVNIFDNGQIKILKSLTVGGGGAHKKKLDMMRLTYPEMK